MELFVNIHRMEQWFIKSGLILIRHHQNIVLTTVEHLTKLLVCGNVLSVFIHIHSSLCKWFLTRIILKSYLPGKSNHNITSGTLRLMLPYIIPDCKIIADCISTAIGDYHRLSLSIYLISAIFKEVRHYHFCLLSNRITMFLVVLK